MVTMNGVESDVVLVDYDNLSRFESGQSYRYEEGGHYKRSPARLTAPRTGDWYAVVRPRGGRVKAEFMLQRGRAASARATAPRHEQLGVPNAPPLPVLSSQREHR